MTTEQAQTVAEIREYANNRVCASLKKGADADVAVNSIYALLQIVDSQAAENERLTVGQNAKAPKAVYDPLNDVLGGPGAPGFD